MKKSYLDDITERVLRIEVSLEDVPDIKSRIRRLELGFIMLVCATGGFDLFMKVAQI